MRRLPPISISKEATPSPASPTLGPTENNGVNISPAALHVALIIRDLKHWEAIKDSAYLVSPPLWNGTVQLHVILQHPRQTPQEMLNKITAVDIGLADPRTIHLAPPDQISLGLPTERDA
jgi:hypothetical protein